MPARRKSNKGAKFPDNWTISETYEVSPTQTLNKGDVCKVKKERGSFTFQKHVVMHRDGKTIEWVTLYGGTNGQEQFRSVYPTQLNVPNKQTPPRPKKNRAKKAAAKGKA